MENKTTRNISGIAGGFFSTTNDNLNVSKLGRPT